MAQLKLSNIQVSELTQEILDSTKKGLGFVPNMYVKMGGNTALLDAYTYAYNSFRTNSGFTSSEQEVVFLSVAYENNCQYCMAAHSFIGKNMTNVPVEVMKAIRKGENIPDLKLAALSRLTRIMTVNRGVVSKEEINNFLAAGYTETHVLGIIAGIGVKTMSNYSNHLTVPVVDDTFNECNWKK